jgi:hypothetical protein
MKLERIAAGDILSGVVDGRLVNVVAAQMNGEDALDLDYRIDGSVARRRLSRADEDGISQESSASDRPSVRRVRRGYVRILLWVAVIVALVVGAYMARNTS